MITLIEEYPPEKMWKLKKMETEDAVLYRPFQARPDMTIYDSRIFDDVQEAIKRCNSLNPEPIAIGIVAGDFPLET